MVTREKIGKDEYRRDSRVWTKITPKHVSQDWAVALGFVGNEKATRVMYTRTKGHAVTISEGWFEDYGENAK